MFERNVLSAVCGAGTRRRNPTLQAEPDATFAVDYASGIATPLVDQGSGYVYNRDTASEYITDYQGLVKQTQVDEMGYDGLRRVENLASSLYSDTTFWDNTGLWDTVTHNQTDVDGGSTATRFIVDGAGTYKVSNDTFGSDGGYPAGVSITESVWVKWVSGNRPTSLTMYAGSVVGGDPLQNRLVLGEWVRLTDTQVTLASNFAYVGLNCIIGGALTLDICYPQVENVTGNENTNPSEYVSVGVGTGSELTPDPTCDNLALWNDPSQITDFTDNLDGSFTTTSNAVIDTAFIAAGTCKTERQYAISFTLSHTFAGDRGFILYDVENNAIGSPFTVGSGETKTFTTVARFNVASGGNDADFYLYRQTSAAYQWTVYDFSIKEIDHGSNVDGVKYFNYANPNEVSSNVVTDSGLRKYFQPSINKGVNIWESRTNLIAESEDFEGTGWQLTGSPVLVSSNTLAPDGSNSAQTWQDNSDVTVEGVWVTGARTIDASTPYTLSCYVKKTTDSRTNAFSLVIADSGGFSHFTTVTLNMDTGEIDSRGVGTSITNIEIGVQNLVDYWRVYLVFESTDTSVWPLLYPAYTTTSNLTGVSGATLGSATFWGVVLEKGAFISPYIETTGASASRNADDLQYDAANYSDEMTVLCEFELPRAGDAAGAVQYLFSAHDTDGAYYISASITPSGFVSVVRNGSGVYVELGTVNLSADTRYKLAIAYSLTGANCAAYLNGTRVGTPISNANSTALTLNEFLIGANEGTLTMLNGYMQNIQTIPRVMSAAELAAWSTL